VRVAIFGLTTPKEVLDELGAGKTIKEVAYNLNVEPRSLMKALQKERERRGARTNYQLVAMHLKDKK
jgi:hypothetical protein